MSLILYSTGSTPSRKFHIILKPIQHVRYFSPPVNDLFIFSFCQSKSWFSCFPLSSPPLLCPSLLSCPSLLPPSWSFVCHLPIPLDIFTKWNWGHADTLQLKLVFQTLLVLLMYVTIQQMSQNDSTIPEIVKQGETQKIPANLVHCLSMKKLDIK